MQMTLLTPYLFLFALQRLFALFRRHQRIVYFALEKVIPYYITQQQQ